MDSYLVDLVHGFAKQGDSVDLWVYEQSQDLPVPENVRVHQVKLRYWFRPFRKIALHTQIVRDLRMSDYDLVIGVMRTAKQHININGGAHISFARNVNGKLRHTDAIPIFFEWRTFRQVQLIIANSMKTAAEIEKDYGVPAAKIHVLYPPTNAARFNISVRTEKVELARKFGVDQNKFSILFPSTNHKVKGLGPLLEAFSLLPRDEYELLIAGAPAGKTDFARNVKYLGYNAEMEQLYAACDLTVLPSHYDAFGLVISESLACGTPVLVSKTSGASELVDAEHGIILENLTPRGIANGIIAARQRSFKVDEHFLRNHGLTVEQHVSAIRALAVKEILGDRI